MRKLHSIARFANASAKTSAGSRKNLQSVLATSTALLMLISTPALADDRENIVKLLADPGVKQTVLKSASQSAVMLNNPCADAKYVAQSWIGIFKPLEFDSTGLLTSGAWKQSVDEEGCGTRRTLNVAVVMKADNHLASGALLPGSSHADPTLQHDSVLIAFNLAGIAAGEPIDRCKLQYVADTEYVGEEGAALAGAKGRPWREYWTVVTCKKKSRVPMLFIPDATGTSFSGGPQTAVTVTQIE
jgi:hypothetical protein